MIEPILCVIFLHIKLHILQKKKDFVEEQQMPPRNRLSPRYINIAATLYKCDTSARAKQHNKQCQHWRIDENKVDYRGAL
jgi:hypothetical protein